MLISFFQRESAFKVPGGAGFYAYFNGCVYYCSREGVDILGENAVFISWIICEGSDNNFFSIKKTNDDINSKKYKVKPFSEFLA